MPSLRFVAYGTPIQQGSARGFAVPIKGAGGQPVINPKTGLVRHRAIIHSDTRRDLASWRAKIASAAQVKCDGRLMIGPVKFSVTFYLPRPKSLTRRVRMHVKTPDLSKLVRAAEDALTGIVWMDDKQVVCYDPVWKRYTDNEVEAPRAEFVITELDEMGNERIL